MIEYKYQLSKLGANVFKLILIYAVMAIYGISLIVIERLILILLTHQDLPSYLYLYGGAQAVVLMAALLWSIISRYDRSSMVLWISIAIIALNYIVFFPYVKEFH